MNENQIHCHCGASWLIWENWDDTIDINNSDFEMSEFRLYTCHKCGRNIEATIYFNKSIKKIEYE